MAPVLNCENDQRDFFAPAGAAQSFCHWMDESAREKTLAAAMKRSPLVSIA